MLIFQSALSLSSISKRHNINFNALIDMVSLHEEKEEEPNGR